MRGLALGACAAAALLALAASSAPEAAPRAKPQLRCGWIQNPTPANWWLVDRDGDWTLMTQGSGEDPPEGMESIPDLTGRNWVVTNGAAYGYGCVCMGVDVDRAARRITRIYSVKQKPLSACRADKRLPKP
ncbi:hypothetical protein QO010_003090 [Caulobacter ginsengisoli]|uniref:DUF4087 domain-containing protein n=1 Tax=Caulobacter ginsengisoli TaxID=400775 RepID=A0ABU0ITG9_9CAUL|nr:DUF4087 domain-containing protein [Caulobacter ginsengisoli]MDQ0465303.1 hypothetical protein [Caulobacter ginsengisoli]